MSPNGGDGAVARRVPDPELPVSRAGEKERESGVEAGVTDGGAVARENRNRVWRWAAARLVWVDHVGWPIQRLRVGHFFGEFC